MQIVSIFKKKKIALLNRNKHFLQGKWENGFKKNKKVLLSSRIQTI